MRGGRSGLLIRVVVVLLLSYCSATCSAWQQLLGKETRTLSSQLQKDEVTQEQYKAMMDAYSQMIMAPVNKQKTDLLCAKQVKAREMLWKDLEPILKGSGFLIHTTDFNSTQDFTPENHPVAKSFLQEVASLQNREEAKMQEEEEQGNDDPTKVIREHLHSMLHGPFNLVRHHELEQQKSNIAVYIWQKLGLFSTFNCVQKFVAEEEQNVFDYFLRSQTTTASNGTSRRHSQDGMEGSNIIALFPSQKWGSAEDEIIIIVAHWDTVKDSSGFNDNGSGMAALLEIARALGQSQCKYVSGSILLAALDLEEVGTHGASAFLHEFLVEKVLRPFHFPVVKGVIVLDSIMTYNTTRDSQDISEHYLKSFPMLSRQILRQGAKGDFMAAFSRTRQDQELLDAFTFHWNQQPNPIELKSFQLRDMEDKPGLPILSKYGEFLRSDHSRFWVANHVDYYASFKSLLISDTGPSRGLMKVCYHASCDSAQFNATQNQDFASMDLLEKVTQTAIDMLLDLTNAKCSGGGGKSRRKIRKHVVVTSSSSSSSFDYTFYDKTTNTSIKGNSNPYITNRTTKTNDDKKGKEELEEEDKKTPTSYYYYSSRPYMHYIYYYVVYPLYYIPSLFYMG